MQLDSAYGDDSKQSFQLLRHRRVLIIGVVVSIGAYAIGLFITVPAALVLNPPLTVSVTGTIWRGKATFAGDNEAAWTANILRSITSFAFAMGWHATGPGTDISGRAKIGFGSVSVDETFGRISSRFVRALVPAASGLCDGEARVNIRSLRFSWTRWEADADFSSGSSICSGSQLNPFIVPPLVARVTSENGVLSSVVVAASAPATILATATLAPDGRLNAELHPEAASVFPGLPRTALTSGLLKIESNIGIP